MDFRKVICLIFCQFEPGVAYKSVAYKKKRVTQLRMKLILLGFLRPSDIARYISTLQNLVWKSRSKNINCMRKSNRLDTNYLEDLQENKLPDFSPSTIQSVCLFLKVKLRLDSQKRNFSVWRWLRKSLILKLGNLSTITNAVLVIRRTKLTGGNSEQSEA